MTDSPDPIRPDEKVSPTDRSGRLVTVAVLLVVVIAAVAALLMVPALRHAPVAVPNVVGESTPTAAATLAKSNFALGAVEVTANPNLTNALVVSQKPAAALKAPRGSAVDVVENLQPHPVPMPSVIGMQRDAADSFLRTYPFTTVFLQQFSDTAPVDAVVAQSPAAGRSWSTGTTVVIELSLGASQNGVRVPDLSGMRITEMQDALSSAGLVAQLYTVANTGVPAGTVIAQLPAPGALVRPESPVAVFAAAATP